jgi:predicted ATP-binding protein involved in virulence
MISSRARGESNNLTRWTENPVGVLVLFDLTGETENLPFVVPTAHHFAKKRCLLLEGRSGMESKIHQLKYPCYDMTTHEVGMLIESFTMDGYKGARNEVILRLHPQMNILFGENGTGKSTLLDGMMVALSWFTARVRSPYANGNAVHENDINNGRNHSKLSIECVTEKNNPCSWTTYKTRRGFSVKGKSDYSQLNAVVRSIQEQREQEGPNVNLPLIGLYPTSRTGLNVRTRIRKRHSFDPITLYESDQIWSANFTSFYEWFRDQQAIENELTNNGPTTLSSDESLMVVRNAIHTFMPDFRNLHFRFRSPQGLYVHKKGFGELRIEKLSGGEQSLIALIGDIARKLVMANPTLSNPLEGRGIILIDEIDLHLHPKWQCSIVENLRKTFPNCQFILTSHSPAIISGGRVGEVHHLSIDSDTISIAEGVPSYGREMDEIFQDFLHLPTIRPKETYDQIKEIYSLMEEDIDKAENLLHELQGIITDDSELEKIQNLIIRKRTIGI